jgi:hypothetical protein
LVVVISTLGLCAAIPTGRPPAAVTVGFRPAPAAPGRAGTRSDPDDRPSHVLIYGDDGSGVDGEDPHEDAAVYLTSILRRAGYAVTNIAPSDRLPTDLRGYGQIWHVSAHSPIPRPDIARLTAFVHHGGGLYLSGERPCCEELNAGDQRIVDALVPGHIRVGRSGDHGNGKTDSLALNPRVAPRSILTMPCSNPRLDPIYAGALRNVRPDRVLARTADGAAIAAIWPAADIRGGGRLAVIMDINWTDRVGPDPVCLTQNLGLFLSGRATSPRLVRRRAQHPPGVTFRRA